MNPMTTARHCTQPIVSNLVCTAQVSTPLYLPFVVQRHSFCEYNRKKFAALTMRLGSPSATCLIFSSGKIVCTGTNGTAQTRCALLTVTRLLRECGYEGLRIRHLRVENAVAAVRWHTLIDLPKFYERHRTMCAYEPELFPGLILRPFLSGIGIFLLFSTGRVVITGCRSRRAIHASRAWLIALILGDRIVGTDAPSSCRISYNGSDAPPPNVRLSPPPPSSGRKRRRSNRSNPDSDASDASDASDSRTETDPPNPS